MKPLVISYAETMCLTSQDEIRRSEESRYEHRVHGVYGGLGRDLFRGWATRRAVFNTGLVDSRRKVSLVWRRAIDRGASIPFWRRATEGVGSDIEPATIGSWIECQSVERQDFGEVH